MTNRIVLFEPRIPASTGNVARTCTTTNTLLRLIEPLEFSTDDKHLRHAGSDYWNDVNITYHKDLTAFLTHVVDKHSCLVTKFAHQTCNEVDYSDGRDHYFLFEEETTDLPETFIRENEGKYIRIPIDDEHVRSLSLSNTAALIVYEVLRQQNFPNLELTHHYENDKLD